MDYEHFSPPRSRGTMAAARRRWQAIALSYTSGTTGNPKGVVYHHRGAYLNAIGNIIAFGLTPQSVYLWTLPMFHCSGWTYTWAVTAAAGTHVCLRRIDPALIFTAIAEHASPTSAARPIVLNLLVNAPQTCSSASITPSRSPPAARRHPRRSSPPWSGWGSG